MIETTAAIKSTLTAYRAATASFEPTTVQAALAAKFANNAQFRICHPFGDLVGQDAFYATCLGDPAGLTRTPLPHVAARSASDPRNAHNWQMW